MTTAISTTNNSYQSLKHVPVRELNVGDLVHDFGSIFRVTEVRGCRHDEPHFHYELEDGTRPNGDTWVAKTDLVEWGGKISMPRHWAEDWNLQGNDGRKYTVVA